MFTIYQNEDKDCECKFIIILVDIIITLILFFLNFSLVMFHIWLKYKKMTTYEYIVYQRAKQELKEI